jgi:hypothetical protein
MTRETLEQRARRLGVPFTSDTTAEELEAVCAVAETERPLQPIEELVKSIGGKLPKCYGEMWDGCGSAGCAGCDAERHCRRDYFEVFNDLLVKAGMTREVDIKEIAEALDIHPDSVVVALRGSTPPKVERKRPTIKLVVEQQGEVQALTPEEIAAAAVDDDPTTGDPAVAGAVDPVAPVEAPAAEPESSAGPMEEKVEVQIEHPAKSKPKAKAKGKAPLRAKAPAKLAKAKAPVKKAKAKSAAKPAKAPAPKRSSNGESAADPFDRERARSPWVRSLKPGQVLKRPMADGSVVRIKVGARGYKDLDTGAIYPTLYKVVCEKAGVSRFPVRDQSGEVIPGKFREMPNYSAQRWFGADG